MWIRTVLRRVWAGGQVFYTDTRNNFYAWLFSLLVGLGGYSLIASFGFANVAARWSMLWFIIASIIFYPFAARTTLAVAIYRIFKGLGRKVGHKSNVRQPKILNVWYWQAFVAMWASSPLALVAILRPSGADRVLQLLLALWAIMNVVATQRNVGAFWRKVYAMCAVTISAVTIFAILNPGDWTRWQGTHQRGQNLSFYEETFQNTLAGKLLGQKKAVDEQLAQLAYEANQSIVAGMGVTPDMNKAQHNLELVRDRIAKQIETQTFWVRYHLDALPDLDFGQVFGLLILLVGVTLMWKGKKKGIKLEKAAPPAGGH